MDPEESTPFIHQPNMIDDDPKKNGLICFLDKERQCGPDCMSFISRTEASIHLDPQQTNCLLLVAAERGSRHLVVLAKLANDAIGMTKKKVQDEKREAQASPPNPVPVKVGP